LSLLDGDKTSEQKGIEIGAILATDPGKKVSQENVTEPLYVDFLSKNELQNEVVMEADKRESLKKLFCRLTIVYAAHVLRFRGVKHELTNSYYQVKFPHDIGWGFQDHALICSLISDGLISSFFGKEGISILKRRLHGWLDPVDDILCHAGFAKDDGDFTFEVELAVESFFKRRSSSASYIRAQLKHKDPEQLWAETLDLALPSSDSATFSLYNRCDPITYLSFREVVKLFVSSPSPILMVDFRSLRSDGTPRIVWLKTEDKMEELDQSFFGRSQIRDLFLFLISKSGTDFVEEDLRQAGGLGEKASQYAGDLLRMLKVRSLSILSLKLIKKKQYSERNISAGKSYYRFRFDCPVIRVLSKSV